MISEDLHRIRVIASKFDTEIKTFKTKYSKARYPRRFIKSVIRDFTTFFDEGQSLVIPPNLFKSKKPFSLFEMLYFDQNKIASKRFTKILL